MKLGLVHGLGLAVLLGSAAFAVHAQPQGDNLANNAMAAAIVNDHILLRPGQTVLVRLAYDGGTLVPRFVAEGEDAAAGDPVRNQVRFTFMPPGGPPVLRIENHSGDRLSFRAAFKDNVGNTTTPESCPAYRGVTDQRIPARAIRVEIDKFSWGGHVRSGQEC